MKGTRGRSASGPNQPRGIKSRLPFWRMGYQAFGPLCKLYSPKIMISQIDFKAVSLAWIGDYTF